MYADYLIPVDVLNDPQAATNGTQRTLRDGPEGPVDGGEGLHVQAGAGIGERGHALQYLCVFKIVSTYREQ
jgi:hypothetical protein